MPIIDLQKRSRELGRIRIGQVVGGNEKKRGRPEKLDRFRLTSASKPLLHKVAALYGGEVREWTPANGGAQQWEVITDAARLPVLVPPQPVTQWLELWSGGGCKRRCDGAREVLSDSPCLCASEGGEDRACKPTTRLNVVLRDVEGIGVWRLESHGWYSALELPEVADFLANAGGYVQAWLALEERVIKKDGEQTRRFMVPTLEVDITPAELMAGKGAIAAVEAPSQTTNSPAIEAAPEIDVASFAAGCSTVDEARALWQRLDAAGQLTEQAKEIITRQVEHIKADADVANGESQWAKPGAETIAAQVPDSPTEDELWQRILTVAGDQGMTLTQVNDHFAARNGGTAPGEASLPELEHYLAQLEGGEAA